MGDEHLISKKDVLDQMGISYGQLYRWKRKGLIPESWFVRRSTFTGQETFFPRDKIIERISRIKDMKGEHALDDLAEVISEHVNAKLKIAWEKLADVGWFDAEVALSKDESGSPGGTISLRDALRMAMADKLRRWGREEEIELARRTLDAAVQSDGVDLEKMEGKTLHLLRKQLSGSGISAEISVIVIGEEDLIVDPEMRRAGTIDLSATLQQVKLDLARCGAEGVSGSEDAAANGRNDHE